ncbi:transketolase [Cellulomonas dongxiuzhuiae]|uniref:Transketolase n=1 Tax=Cellulomonas dongxiuzhuiae TaxID=2819979 RepID=A0ABX8GFK2_9CELL|nr:transketolase [Cellulomonas dongxiuzhuiae]MBO3087098.1 transketolase [Cellulomonas dongxiuzhuiae]MBO3093528.1 transketolase [Cellulomonas dongxiuzhuiae]QWC14657.1 transketolase [Cellulomonas dongxiuzhuiae]
MNAKAPLATKVGWSDLDLRAVDTTRVLAADAVEKVGNGHPGTAISLAPAAYLLYQTVMRHDPTDPHWLGRDRFVLSAGHSSLTQYIQLYLAGFGLELEDLEALRTWGSKTPGHPEYRHTAGVEITTGPLGQGLASAVGFAMAARRERGLLDPEAAPGTSPFDHHVYVIASDGDLQEGVTSEASSIAGTQELGNLVVLWDDNHISIEGDTQIAFTEDVLKRYESYGWHVQFVDWTAGGEYREDVDALHAAIEAAKAVTDKPSFIGLRTLIAWPTPGKTDDHSSHGSKLGGDAIRGLKEVLGFDPEKTFEVAPEVIAHTRSLADRAATERAAWQEAFDAWAAANPDRKALLDRLRADALPEGWTEALPTFPAGKSVATRAASGEVLSALAPVLPELWGGSADLAGSNNTTMKGEPSFLPAHRSSHEFAGDEFGRTLHFGIREHAMGSILSGIRLHGLTRPYGGTFFTFSDYMRGAVRLAALMGVNVTYVWTHDSIGLGEDGPTHQPVEHLTAVRAIPGLAVVRPADANETAAAWRATLERTDGPVALVLTRQNVPTYPRGEDGFATTDGVTRGAYVLLEASSGTPDVVLIGTGSEVQLAVEARETLEAAGVATRVVSAPCLEWFAEQDEEYRESVLPSAVRARVSVEAGIAMSWHKIVGDAGRSVSIEHYGASADYQTLYREFGITAEAVVAAAHESLAAARGDDRSASAPGTPTQSGTGDLPA